MCNPLSSSEQQNIIDNVILGNNICSISVAGSHKSIKRKKMESNYFPFPKYISYDLSLEKISHVPEKITNKMTLILLK